MRARHAVDIRKKPARRSRLGPWAGAAERRFVLKAHAERAFETRPKLQRLVKALGVNATANLLGSDRGQLSRCAQGTEGIGAELTRRIIDAEYVLDRALKVMWPDEVGPWLTAPEPLLGGSIPLNVLVLVGPAEVVKALDARAAGAYA